MNNQPYRVLYAKYNSTRRPEFRLTTEICEGADGRFVRKLAGEEAARAHLENIVQNRNALKDYYQGIQVIDTEQEGNSVQFPFVTGQTLAEQIDMQSVNRQSFVDAVNNKLTYVLSVQKQFAVSFEQTDGFQLLFGNLEIGSIPAYNPANIDSLFTNFVENDSGIYCIDYEWVCHFPVPVDFIKYRILRYLYLNQSKNKLDGCSLEEMLGWFGFTEEEQETYRRAEMNFQQYIHGKGWKFIYTEHYKKRNLSIEGLNQEIQNQKKIVFDKNVHIQNQEKMIIDKDIQIQNQEKMIIDKEVHIQNQNAQIRRLMADYQTISNAFFWKITKPARMMTDGIKKAVKKNEAVYLMLRMVKDTIGHGFGYAKNNRRAYIETQRKLSEANSWPSAEERNRQSSEVFPKTVTFSILVPLYNTPEVYLKEMIESVRGQTYPNWELCLADGSDREHGSVGKLCREYAQKDQRIHYQKLEKNLGISGNTNACIDMATGEYIALFDHDDILHPSALYECMKAICQQDADFIYTDENTFHDTPKDAYCPHYKPDFAPDTLRSYNYICHLSVFSSKLLKQAGGVFRSECDGSQDYDLILRLTEKAKSIVHIPKIMYYWRSHATSTAADISAKPYTLIAAKRALEDHLKRVGLKGTVEDSRIPSTYHIQYAINKNDRVSIIIPNKDHVGDLDKCITSIKKKTTYTNWEIIVVENNSTEAETFEYYRQIERDSRIRVVYFKGAFNYSAINNFGAKQAEGKYLLLLNNDTEVITPDWLEQMLMFAQREDVGAVGAMLYYPDDTVQHAGVILGVGGVAGHSHKYFSRNDNGYMSRMSIAQNFSAVTAACVMIPTKVWKEIGGLDEKFAIAFNDVDLCMRIRKANYMIVWTPYAELYHYESKSRGFEDTKEKQARFSGEVTRFMERWKKELEAGDPYYNPNLTLKREDFSFRDD